MLLTRKKQGKFNWKFLISFLNVMARESFVAISKSNFENLYTYLLNQINDFAPKMLRLLLKSPNSIPSNVQKNKRVLEYKAFV